MPICRDCKREVLHSYQQIITKMKNEIIICDECLRGYKRNAGDSKEVIREHK